MVPSWTETLILADVPVRGRTRFCLHPDRARAISVVGGTKDISWDKVRATGARLILLDREENPRAMFDEAIERGLEPVVTHVTSIAACARDLRVLGEKLSAPALSGWAEELLAQTPATVPLDSIVETWIKKPQAEVKTVLYLIWKNPWMAVARDTYVGDVCRNLGLNLPHFDKPYPEINPGDYDPATTLILLSSEPYPFRGRGHDDPEIREFPRAIVDGESFSWFGRRSLSFLQKVKAP